MGVNWEKLKRKQVPPPKLQEIVDDDIEVPVLNKVLEQKLIFS